MTIVRTGKLAKEAEFGPRWEMAGWQDLPALTAVLTRRGYTEARLTRIFHAKFLRVIHEITG